MKAAWVVAPALLSLSLPRHASALDAETPIDGFIQRSWAMDTGLPQPDVRAFAQTADGFLWIGTDGGLVRFDGVKFEVIGAASPEAFPVRRVHSLLVDQKGALWLGTRGSGLVRLKNGRLESFRSRLGLEGAGVLGGFEDKNGDLWFGGWYGLARLRGESPTPLGPAFELPRESVNAIRRDATGTLWIAGSEGLWRMTAGRLEPVTHKGRPIEFVRALEFDGAGRLWIATYGGGLLRQSGEGLRRFTTADGLPSDQINALRVDGNGNLWIGTHSGLVRLRGEDSFERAPAEHPLSRVSVEALFEDREASLWIGTRGAGAIRLSASRFRRISIRRKGGTTESATAVHLTPGGDVWIGTDGDGLLLHRDGALFRPPGQEKACPSVVFVVRAAPDGAVWIGGSLGERSNLCVLRDGAFRPIAGAEDVSIRALHPDGQGRVWVGARGIFRVNDDHRLEQVHVPEHPTLSRNTIFSIAPDSAGGLWFGSAAGAAHLEGETWRMFGFKQGLPSPVVLSVHADADGDVWLGTLKGLIRIRGKTVRSFARESALLSDVVFKVLADNQRSLWLCTAAGLLRVAKQTLDSPGRTSREGLAIRRYSASDGLYASQCSGGETDGTIWKSVDQRLWLATGQGIAWIDPNRADSSPTTPVPVIEKVLVDGQEPISASGLLSPPPGRGTIEITFTAPSFIAPESIRFRYRLEPFDRAWVDAGSRRQASYANILPGTYRFQVMANKSDGTWGTHVASVALRLRAPLHKTSGFRLGAGAAVTLAMGGAAWGAHRLRVKRIRVQHEAILAERGRIARELHDTLAQGFTGMSLHLETAVHALHTNPGEARVSLEKARALARQSLTEARRAVADLRSIKLEKGDLISALAKIGEDLGGTIPIRLQINGRTQPLPRAVEDAILRIAEEAVTNSVKHARSSSIVLELSYLSTAVQICVRDDGSGFDSQSAPSQTKRFGLVGIRERAEALEGEVALESRPGAGTELAVTFPVGPDVTKREDQR